MAKLPQDLLERGVDIYSVVLNYCIDLICWDKTDELPDYLDVTYVVPCAYAVDKNWIACFCFFTITLSMLTIL